MPIGLQILVFTLVIIVAVGTSLWATDHLRARGKVKRPVVAPKPQVETYGHPLDPFAETKKLLPKLKGSHVWELKSTTKADDVRIVVSVVDTATGQNLASTSRSLIWRNDGNSRDIYGTIAARYLEFPTLKKKIMTEEIVAPLVGWATTQVHTLPAPARQERYEIGD